MANSVEIRSPFLDKEVYLYMLSLPLEMKIKNGKLNSIIKDSFNDILPDYIKDQKFKQGLPVSKRNLNDSVIKNICLEVIGQRDFNNHCWDNKKIKKDFINNKNQDLVWNIVKYYLLKQGFKDRLLDAGNYKVDFSAVPLLQ
jgi:asparagine synthase (glutamine-hydrolysing)